MKTDKEYPATHSMSTAWYCCDKDGNVAIIDIDDNGPVPVDQYRDTCLEEILWDDFPEKNDTTIPDFPLALEQILPMLVKHEDDDNVWQKDSYGWRNFWWSELIVKVDNSKIGILEKAVEVQKKEYGNSAICLSKEHGYYYLDFYSNKEGADLLVANDVILEHYKVPYYDAGYDSEVKCFPMFIYHQDYWPSSKAAVKINSPSSPLKVNQLPKQLQKGITKLPLLFNETDVFQLAQHLPVVVDGHCNVVYQNKGWYQLALPNDDFAYYNPNEHTFISKLKMAQLLVNGDAEEYEYRKHYDILYKKQND